MAAPNVPWPAKCARARCVERGDGTLPSAHVAMAHAARVNVRSHSRPCRVDPIVVGTLERTCAGAWNVVCDDGAVRSAHEGVIQITAVKVACRDRSRRVDTVASTTRGALARACARALRFERGDDTVGCAHEAVIDIVGMNVESVDLPRRVDTLGVRALVGFCACAGASNDVIAPSGARRKPRTTLLAST
jgi:hypothetical protein